MKFSLFLLLSLLVNLFSLPAKMVTDDGAWCWFTEPRAITHSGKTYTGWVTKKGHIVAASIDAVTHEIDTAIMRPQLQYDDHANPSFMMWPNGKLFCFYSAHNDSRIRIRTLQTPGSFNSWTSEVGIPMANITDYPCPHMLPSEDSAVYVFFRGGPAWNPYFVKSTDKCVTWSSIRHFISSPGARPYFKMVSNGKDEIHVVFTDGHPRNNFNNVYYVRYKNNALYRADGSYIKSMDSLPLLLSEAEKIYDATTHNAKAWVWDIALDSNKYPVAAYVNFPNDRDHRYRFIRWNGTEWKDQELVKSGKWFPQTPVNSGEPEPNYSGGIQLDHSNPYKIFLARQDSVTGVFGIERWLSSDQGQTWKITKVIGGNDTLCVRPVIPHGVGSGMEFMFMKGKYIHYADFHTSIHMVSTIDITPPSNPTSLTATVYENCVVTLSWSGSVDNETGISGYRLFRGNTPSSLMYLRPVGNVLSATDTFVGISDTLYYAVVAVNGNDIQSISKSNTALAVLPAFQSALLVYPKDTIASYVSTQITAHIRFASGHIDSSNTGITFYALDTNIVTVTQYGRATARDTIGVGRIIARRGGTWLNDTCRISVVRGEINYIRRFNFRCSSLPYKYGWISDSGAAYDSVKGYGWVGCAATPESRCDRAGGSLLGTFVMVRGSLCNNGEFRVNLPDGEYIVRIGLGDASYQTEPLNVKYNGTTIASYSNPGNLGNGYSVCDAVITVAGGNGAGFVVGGTPNAKISYMVILSSQGIDISSVADDSLSPGSTALQKSYSLKKETFITAIPNPFNRNVSFDFGVSSDGICKIDIHSVDGKLIKHLFNGYARAGKQTIKWNGEDKNGRFTPAGIYIVRITSNGMAKSTRIRSIK